MLSESSVEINVHNSKRASILTDPSWWVFSEALMSLIWFLQIPFHAIAIWPGSSAITSSSSRGSSATAWSQTATRRGSTTTTRLQRSLTPWKRVNCILYDPQSYIFYLPALKLLFVAHCKNLCLFEWWLGWWRRLRYQWYIHENQINDDDERDWATAEPTEINALESCLLITWYISIELISVRRPFYVCVFTRGPVDKHDWIQLHSSTQLSSFS